MGGWQLDEMESQTGGQEEEQDPCPMHASQSDHSQEIFPLNNDL